MYDVDVTESSQELEELRGAFSRSLDYINQDVEESKWVTLRLCLQDGYSVYYFNGRCLCCCRIW